VYNQLDGISHARIGFLHHLDPGAVVARGGAIHRSPWRRSDRAPRTRREPAAPRVNGIDGRPADKASRKLEAVSEGLSEMLQNCHAGFRNFRPDAVPRQYGNQGVQERVSSKR
jgi:hypothetical protein